MERTGANCQSCGITIERPLLPLLRGCRRQPAGVRGTLRAHGPVHGATEPGSESGRSGEGDARVHVHHARLARSPSDCRAIRLASSCVKPHRSLVG